VYSGAEVLSACIGGIKSSKMCLAVPQVRFDYVIYHIYERLEKRTGDGRDSLVIAENYWCCGLKIRK